MDMKKLLQFISLEDSRLKARFENYPDTEKRILARTVKLNEEVGELCNEVLAFNSMQRKEKLEHHDGKELEHEFADVIITTLLLANTMGVDIEKALEGKIEKINSRYKKE